MSIRNQKLTGEAHLHLCRGDIDKPGCVIKLDIRKAIHDHQYRIDDITSIQENRINS